MNTKKGISAVIATVLLILITVAAVTIIWVAVIPMITGVIDNKQECLAATTGLNLVADSGYTCYQNMNNISVQISRGTGDFDLKNIQVIFESKGETRTFNLLDNKTTWYPEDENKGLTSNDLPIENNQRVYKINASSSGFSTAPETVKIAAVVSDDGNACDASQAVVLKACEN